MQPEIEATNKETEKISKSCCANMPWMTKLEQQLNELENILLIKTCDNIPEGTWPRCWRVIAWVIVGLTALTCLFFVVLYSMEWGRDVSEQWLSAFMLSFMQSMFIVDPFKVIMTSAILAILFRKWKVKETDVLDLRVITQVNKEYGVKEKTKPPREYISFQSSLTDEEMKALALKRLVQVMLTKTLREIIVHIMFLWVVCSLCFISRTPGDFRMVETIKAALVTPHGVGFSSVRSTDQYFDWLDKVVTPFLFPATDYEGRLLLSEDRMFTAARDLYRLGAPRLRQARMRKNNTSLPIILQAECPSDKVQVHECVMKYSINAENTREYCLGWTDPPCPHIDQLRITSGAWYYRSSVDVWGIPISGSYNTYSGGGYISNLDINILVAKTTMQELKEFSWIDRATRAVFLEFTLFCPNTNQFAYVILLAEFLESGGVVPSVSIAPFKPYRPEGWLGTYVVVCELLGVFFTALSLVYVGYRFYHERRAALKDKWFLLDVLAVLTAMLTISMFSSRLSFTNAATAKMKEDITQFVNFYHVAVWDFAYTVSLAFLVAIGWFRLLKLAGYSERTYKKASEQTLLQLASKFYHMLFGVVGVLIFSNFFLAVLGDLFSEEPTQVDPLTEDEGKVFLVLWDSILQALGRDVDPIDRLRRVVQTNNKSDSKPPPAEDLQALGERGENFIHKLKSIVNRSASSQDEDFIFRLSMAHIEEAERKKRKSFDTAALKFGSLVPRR
ncbi:polycystic kidney disease 2-like 1 protein [Elysia marginata]|uniref:Polycystic kidney disease 2-like 1 protein n=1 Tax=Elysia marginata TaxID=1093978 RepID=A0AAV4GC57_9GAST|nr:polycystic kidney disease 2-like 1 protein [Elysia marginata]